MSEEFPLPDDIRVIGFDNIERCTEARIPLTTIEVPRYEIGVKAYEILRKFMRDGHTKVPPRTLIDPKLIVRNRRESIHNYNVHRLFFGFLF